MMVSYSKIGEKDNTNEVKKRVEAFMSENEVNMARFFEMHDGKTDSSGHPYTMDNLVDLVRRTRYELFVSMSSWSSSEEGIEYWTELSDTWEDFFAYLVSDFEEFFSDDSEREPKQFFFKKNGVVKPREDAA